MFNVWRVRCLHFQCWIRIRALRNFPIALPCFGALFLTVFLMLRQIALLQRQARETTRAGMRPDFGRYSRNRPSRSAMRRLTALHSSPPKKKALSISRRGLPVFISGEISFTNSENLQICRMTKNPQFKPLIINRFFTICVTQSCQRDTDSEICSGCQFRLTS